MSNYAMPIIILNLGGEMVYILHQRLNAQKVAKDKERKVLREVIATMHEITFLSELFQPQKVYGMDDVKQIFDKLAHSSLMRLNTSSMNKLFDLMIMGLKHQIVNLTSPRDVVNMTYIHLRCMRNLIVEGGDSAEPKAMEAVACLQAAEKMLRDTFCASGPCGNLASLVRLKSTIFSFLQGKKIKASLFLQRKQQGVDGRFVLSNAGMLPQGTQIPGTIKVFKNQRPVRVYNVRLSMACFAHSTKRTCGVWDPTFELGTNVYAINLSTFCMNNSSDDKQMAEQVHSELVELMGPYLSDDLTSAAEVRSTGLTAEAARAEAKLTSSLLGGSAGGGSKSDSKGGTPKLHLMSLLGGGNSGGGTLDHGAGSKDDDGDLGGFIEINMMEIDAQSDAKTMDSMLESLDFKDFDKGAGQAKADSKSYGDYGGEEDEDDDDEDDLLALMDGAK